MVEEKNNKFRKCIEEYAVLDENNCNEVNIKNVKIQSV